EDVCRACKLDRMHTVIAADAEGRPIRVACGYCDSEHNYRGGPAVARAPSSASFGGASPAVNRAASSASFGGASPAVNRAASSASFGGASPAGARGQSTPDFGGASPAGARTASAAAGRDPFPLVSERER